MWISLPSECSPSVPASGDSIADSIWRSDLLSLSVTWRGKLQPANSWQREWVKGSWTPRLYGRISTPLTAARGVAWWIACWADIPVNPSQWRGSSEVIRTPGICGPASSNSSAISPHPSARLRMSATIYVWDSSKSTETYQDWATRLRRGCLLRRKSGRATSGSGCSLWATATQDVGRTTKYAQGGTGLAAEASMWPTAKVSSGDYSYSSGDHSKIVMNLEGAAKAWATPHANMITGAGTQGRQGGMNLQTQGTNWATPRATDGEKGGPNQQDRSGSLPLPSQNVQWATPTSRDWRSDLSQQTDAELYGTKGRPLSRQVQVTYARGQRSSINSPKLNPRFVEWLMGLPQGWTDFAPLATVWFQHKPDLPIAS